MDQERMRLMFGDDYNRKEPDVEQVDKDVICVRSPLNAKRLFNGNNKIVPYPECGENE